MRTFRISIGLSMLVFCLALIAACQSQAPTAPPAPAEPTYLPTATIKDLMLSIVDPSADVVWLSVTTIVDEKGLVETVPKTDEEWKKVRHGAIALAEAANLLKMPGRRVAQPGEKSETPGVELEPARVAGERYANIARM